MSMNAAPKGERAHIGFFGRTNTGKSSLINAITNQEISIVSPVAGTTTDPVEKTMELPPLGPVVLIDTAGIDDETELGVKRVAKTMDVLRKTDVAVLVASAAEPPDETEKRLLAELKSAGIPAVVALNKSDLGEASLSEWGKLAEAHGAGVMSVSAESGAGVNELKNYLSVMLPDKEDRVLIRDIVHAGETCVLVVPIDSAAPKGRLILPQQQVIRDLLEGGAKALVTRELEYQQTLESLKEPPALVVTDSQVFGFVSKLTPAHIPLTSFSILFARYKGNINQLASAARAVDTLENGDHVLICEGCTHHRQCDDIGSVKLPKWICEYTGKKPDFAFTSGSGFPKELSTYKLIVHCGGCMLSEREMKYRLRLAESAGVPAANYGVLIAHMNGILERTLKPLG